jgi:hypothetical protein
MKRATYRAHPFLRLAHEDFLGRERGVTQRYVVELDAHAARAVGGELAGRAGQPGRTEVRDAGDQLLGEDLQRALDEQLLLEGVTDLDGGTLRGLRVVEGLGRQDRGTPDAVTTRTGAVEDHLVAGA